jgi:hypothetical protein
VAANLADVLPGEAIIYLENRGLAGRSLQNRAKALRWLVWHYPCLQSGDGTKPTGQAVPRVARARLPLCEESHGEDIDLKAQRALVKGINCDVTGPKLRKAQEKPGCTFAELVKMAEPTESRYLLKRDDPVMTKYISDILDVLDGSNPVWTMGPEEDDPTPTCRVKVSRKSGSQAISFNCYADATCFKCGEKGQVAHIRGQTRHWTPTGPVAATPVGIIPLRVDANREEEAEVTGMVETVTPDPSPTHNGHELSWLPGTGTHGRTL